MSKDELKTQVKIRFQIIGSIMIDNFFLLCWLILTIFTDYITNLLINKYDLSGMDIGVFIILQWSLSGSTLIPVASFLIVDIWTIIVRTKYEVLKIQKKSTKTNNIIDKRN